MANSGSKTILLSIIIVTLVSCKARFIPNLDPDFEVLTITPDGSEKYMNEGSEYIFDQNNLRTFELRIPGSSLNFLDQDPSAEEYIAAMLIFEGDTISPVGLRYKGSIGAWMACLSGKNIFEPSGFKKCSKLSMKIKINWEGRDEKFFKLKKLQLHAQNQDPSYMKERLGYWIFDQMGVPSPRSVHAKLVVNGAYIGLFALTEQIDNRFIKQNFDDDKGNLYKEVWPLHTDGLPFDDQHYINGLKTNDHNSPNIELMKSVAQKLADADSVEARQVVKRYMDIDEIMAYIAVDRTIRHDDGPFHWYCNNEGCSNHNYYWYEEPDSQKLHLIPWDIGNAFENIIENSNFITPIYNNLGDTSNDCQGFKYLHAWQWSASCDKLTATWASYTDKLKDQKERLVNGPLAEDSVNEKLDAWSMQIKNAIVEAKVANDDGLSVEQWESAIEELKDQIKYVRMHSGSQ